MKGLIFPIADIQGNKIIAISGNVGHFYKVAPPDLEQMAPLEYEGFFEQISACLDCLDDQAYFKFYSWNGISYLETNSKVELVIPNVTTLPQNDALKIFFHETELISDIGIHDDYLSFQGNYWRILSVKSWSAGDINLDFIPDGVDYVLTVKRKPAEQSIKILDRIRQKHISTFFKGKRDLESEGSYFEAEGLMEDIGQGQESLFSVELFFVLKDLSLERLQKSTLEFQSLMAAKGVKLYLEGQSLLHLKSGLGELFNELIPGVKPTLSLRAHIDKTTHLRYLLPLRRSALMDDGIELADQHGVPIFFDPFLKSLKNKNMLVTGTTGAGKSVFVNKIVHSTIDHHPTVILDKGGSYKRLALYHDGYVLENGFNPLQFRDPLYLREFILSLVDQETFGKLEQGRLLFAIKAALKNEQVQNFSQLIHTLEPDFPGIHFYFEECGIFFTDSSIPEVSILYVDVENFPKGIVAPLIIFLLEYFKHIRTEEKILVFDECWSFLKQHGSYIDECFRTFRKTGALPIAISQGLRDFSIIDKTLADSLTNTSYFKAFFPQELDESSDITRDDLACIQSLRFSKGQFSDCYLKSQDNKYRKIMRIYLTPLELELFNTEISDSAPFMQFFKQNRAYFSSNQETIDAYIRIKYGNYEENSYPRFRSGDDTGPGEQSPTSRQ